jgi:alcohol dehydrogenase, propanol-preferring
MNIKYLDPCGEIFNELREVIELLNEGIIKNNISKFKLDDVNEAIRLLKEGQIVGRGV